MNAARVRLAARPWSGVIKRDEGSGGSERQNRTLRGRSKGDKKTVKHIGKEEGRPQLKRSPDIFGTRLSNSDRERRDKMREGRASESDEESW